jgi:hypothetical protein
MSTDSLDEDDASSHQTDARSRGIENFHIMLLSNSWEFSCSTHRHSNSKHPKDSALMHALPSKKTFHDRSCFSIMKAWNPNRKKAWRIHILSVHM